MARAKAVRLWASGSGERVNRAKRDVVAPGSWLKTDGTGIVLLPTFATISIIALMRGWANPNRVTFSFVRSTGLYSGSFQFTADGGSRCGRFSGVLMPGWVDCRCGRDTREAPFGMGGAWVPKKATLPAQSFTFDLKACE